MRDIIKQEIKEGKFYNNKVLNVYGLKIIIKNNADKTKVLKAVQTLERATGIDLLPVLAFWGENFYNVMVSEQFKKAAEFIGWIYFMGRCSK